MTAPGLRKPFRPVATLWLCALLAGIQCFVASRSGRNWPSAFDFIPAYPWRWQGLTFLTATLLHYGWRHLLGNVLMILIFGSHVEHRIRGWRVIVVFLVAGAAGHVAHGLLDPRPFMHSGGASGGAFGLLAFYALAFRREPFEALADRLRRWCHLKERSRSPAALKRIILSGLKRLGFPDRGPNALHMLGLFTTIELIGLGRQLAGSTNVSSAAHLGGILGGAACYGIAKRVRKAGRKAGRFRP